jgi:hypothetical protein
MTRLQGISVEVAHVRRKRFVALAGENPAPVGNVRPGGVAISAVPDPFRPKLEFCTSVVAIIASKFSSYFAARQ